MLSDPVGVHFHFDRSPTRGEAIPLFPGSQGAWAAANRPGAWRLASQDGHFVVIVVTTAWPSRKLVTRWLARHRFGCCGVGAPRIAGERKPI
jgi:hypothetical protein